jgi:DhnA family fructose-bisphosphate aldolase class Ia
MQDTGIWRSEEMSSYSMSGYKFDLKKFFPIEVMSQITEARVRRPEIVLQEAHERKRRDKLTDDGKLTILAADHPARMVTSFGDDPVAMADRQQYLGRVLRVATSPGVDGVMGTTDIIEDLLIMNRLVKEKGGRGFLDGRVILGSMNRSGLAGSAWELDDRYTCFTPESISELNLDAAKVMIRIDLGDEKCNETLDRTAWAVSECNEMGMPMFLECLAVERSEGKLKVKKNAADLIKVMGVATALGDSSRGIWLKIPYCEEYDRVARATTCPILMLGGESKGDPTPTLRDFAAGMRAGPAVRGALVGRNVTFPGDDDPLAVALAVNGVVHEGLTADQAVERLMKSRDENFDALTKWLGG